MSNNRFEEEADGTLWAPLIAGLRGFAAATFASMRFPISTRKTGSWPRHIGTEADTNDR
jgi:hypothetical protein